MNIMVTHPYMTALRYLKGNFFLDLFCVFPFEVFVLIPVGGDFTSIGRTEVLHWIMYLSLNRMFQIYRLPLAFHFLESNIKYDTSRLFTIKYCTYFVLYITLITCLPLTIECPPLGCAVQNQTCCT